MTTRTLILLEFVALWVGTVMVRYENDHRKPISDTRKYYSDLFLWSLKPALASTIIAGSLIITADLTKQTWPALFGLMIVTSTLMVEGLQVADALNNLSAWLIGK